MLLGDDAESSDYDDFYADPEEAPSLACEICSEDKCDACDACLSNQCEDFRLLECATCRAELFNFCACSTCETLVCGACGDKLVPSFGDCERCFPTYEQSDGESEFCLVCEPADAPATEILNEENVSKPNLHSTWSGPLVATTQHDLPADLTDVVAELKSLRAEAKTLEVRQAELREVILKRMGDQVDGKVDGRVVLKIVRGVRKSFDSKRFIKERPQEALEYLSETETVTVRTM